MTPTNDMTLYHQLQQIYVLLDDGDRRSLQPFNLSPTQYNLLLRLGTDIESGLTMTELANQMLCTRGNITRLVQRCQEQQLVQTGSDANDQRLVRVALTPLGLEKCRAAQMAHQTAVQRRFQALAPTDQQNLLTLTQTLVTQLTTDLTQLSSL